MPAIKNRNKVGLTLCFSANSAGLSFLGGQYLYYWITNAAWRGTCRTFQMALNDGTVKTANFRFYN